MINLVAQTLSHYVMDMKTQIGEVYSAPDKLRLLDDLVTKLEAMSRGVRDTLERLTSLLTSTGWLTAGLEAETVWGLLSLSQLDARYKRKHLPMSSSLYLPGPGMSSAWCLALPPPPAPGQRPLC